MMGGFCITYLHLYPYIYYILYFFILCAGNFNFERWSLEEANPMVQKDGKFEHYWPLDIIQIPPDFATCIIQKTPWLNLSIMHKHQNTSTSYLFQNLPYQNCPNVLLHDVPLFVFTLCLTTHNSMNLKIDQLSYKNQMILNEMNYKN